MNDHQSDENYPDATEFYRRMESRKAKVTEAEMMAAMERLRQLEPVLAPIREMNKALRAAKKIKIRFKTR